MRFVWPDLLWLLLLIPALVAAYIWVLRRRKRVAIRYASLLLVRDALGPGQRIRRHVPPALFLLAMTAAIIAVARPSATVTLPSEYMTVVLAMDVSLSMRANDVEPNRIVAAQNAAKEFINELPRNVRLGIVSFAGTAAVVQTPTENRQDMLNAIDRFQLQRATATGSGLLLSLSLLFPEDGLDLESVVFSGPFSQQRGVPLDRAGQVDDAGRKPQRREVVPVPVGSYASGAVILLSDGRRTTGPDPLEIAKMAADRGVRVYTVGFGTLQGTTIGVDGYSFFVRLDEETLKAIAKATGGEYFHAGTAADLRKVYEALNAKLALERRDTEVSALFSALAVFLALLAGVLSLLWFHRGAAAVTTAPVGGAAR
jgi:Ca-activated chloride channel family protein